MFCAQQTKASDITNIDPEFLMQGYFKQLFLYVDGYYKKERSDRKKLICNKDQLVKYIYEGWYWNSKTKQPIGWKTFRNKAYRNFNASEYQILYDEIIKSEKQNQPLLLCHKRRIIGAYERLKIRAKLRLPMQYLKSNNIDYRILDINHVITVRTHKSFHGNTTDILTSSREIKLLEIIKNSPFDEDTETYLNSKENKGNNNNINTEQDIIMSDSYSDIKMKESGLSLPQYLHLIINTDESNDNVLMLQKQNHTKLKTFIEQNICKSAEIIYGFTGRDKNAWHKKIADYKSLRCHCCNGRMTKTEGFICVFGSMCSTKNLSKEIQLLDKNKNKPNNEALNCHEQCTAFVNSDGIPVCNADLYAFQILKKDFHKLHSQLKKKYQRNSDQLNAFKDLCDVLNKEIIKVILRFWGKWYIQLIGHDKQISYDHEIYNYFDMEELPNKLSLFNKRPDVIYEINNKAKQLQITSLHASPNPLLMTICKSVTISAEEFLCIEDRNKFAGSQINIIEQKNDGHIKNMISYVVNYPNLIKMLNLLIKLLVAIKLLSVYSFDFCDINGYDYEYDELKPIVKTNQIKHLDPQIYTIKTTYIIFWDGFNLKYLDYFAPEYEVPIKLKDKYTPKKIEQNPIFQELMKHLIKYFQYSMDFIECATQINPGLIKFHFPLQDLEEKYNSHNVLLSFLQYLYDRMLRHCDAKQIVTYESMGDDLMHWLPNETSKNFNGLFQGFSNVKEIIQTNDIITVTQIINNMKSTIKEIKMSNVIDIIKNKNTIQIIESDDNNIEKSEYKLMYTSLDKVLCLNCIQPHCSCGDGSMDLPCDKQSGNIFSKQGLLFQGHVGTNINGTTCVVGVRVQDLENNENRFKLVTESDRNIYKQKNSNYISGRNKLSNFEVLDNLYDMDEEYKPSFSTKRINIDDID